MTTTLTAEFERSFQALVDRWERHHDLRGSTDFVARAEARAALDTARQQALRTRSQLPSAA